MFNMVSSIIKQFHTVVMVLIAMQAIVVRGVPARPPSISLLSNLGIVQQPRGVPVSWHQPGDLLDRKLNHKP